MLATLIVSYSLIHNTASNPRTTDQVLNGVSKNLEDTLTDRDRQKMTDSLMQKLQQVKNESSSDEESQEHKNLMFEDAASSAGREYTISVYKHTVSCCKLYLDL